MKKVFGYSEGNIRLEIRKHKDLFYLYEGEKRIARADNEKVLRSYIDGYSRGYEKGSDKWFKAYLDQKQKVKDMI